MEEVKVSTLKICDCQNINVMKNNDCNSNHKGIFQDGGTVPEPENQVEKQKTGQEENRKQSRIGFQTFSEIPLQERNHGALHTATGAGDSEILFVYAR